ncbi:MAG: hypothetical protein ACK4J0_01230 [Candidatus Anstonellaceae archaeon]
MPKVQMDSVYGLVKNSYPIFEDNFEQIGTIYTCEQGVVIKYKDQLIRAPYEYVRKMERVSNLALGKVSVIFQIYDQSGMEHNMAVALNDIHFSILKKMFPNAL